MPKFSPYFTKILGNSRRGNRLRFGFEIWDKMYIPWVGYSIMEKHNKINKVYGCSQCWMNPNQLKHGVRLTLQIYNGNLTVRKNICKALYPKAKAFSGKSFLQGAGNSNDLH